MYALVSLWQLRESGFEDRWPRIEQQLLAFVRPAPGFVEGYWTYERANGKSVGFTLLDTADHAHDLRVAIENQIETEIDPDLQLELIRVQEIVTYVAAAKYRTFSGNGGQTHGARHRPAAQPHRAPGEDRDTRSSAGPEEEEDRHPGAE